MESISPVIDLFLGVSYIRQQNKWITIIKPRNFEFVGEISTSNFCCLCATRFTLCVSQLLFSHNDKRFSFYILLMD